MNPASSPIDVAKTIAAIQEAGARWIHDVGVIAQPNNFNEAWKMCADALASEP